MEIKNLTNEQLLEIYIAGMNAQAFIQQKEKELAKKLEKGQNTEQALDDLMSNYTKENYDVYVVDLYGVFLDAKTYLHYNYFEKGFLLEKVEIYDDDEYITTINFTR